MLFNYCYSVIQGKVADAVVFLFFNPSENKELCACDTSFSWLQSIIRMSCLFIGVPTHLFLSQDWEARGGSVSVLSVSSAWTYSSFWDDQLSFIFLFQLVLFNIQSHSLNLYGRKERRCSWTSQKRGQRWEWGRKHRTLALVDLNLLYMCFVFLLGVCFVCVFVCLSLS